MTIASMLTFPMQHVCRQKGQEYCTPAHDGEQRDVSVLMSLRTQSKQTWCRWLHPSDVS
jgi:hypothetical protein